MDERQDPGARLRALGQEAVCRAPDGEEALLDGVLGERRVAHDPEREAVGDPSVAVVELREGVLVGPGDEREQGLVREFAAVAIRL